MSDLCQHEGTPCRHCGEGIRLEHLSVAVTMDWTGTQNVETRHRPATVADLVAALREEGVGEVVEAETCAERHVGCTTLEVVGLLPGDYLVVRIEGTPQ